jgi:hypothetical protein
MTLGIIDPPDGFERTLGPLSPDVAVHHDVAGSDIFILFGRWADELEESFQDAAALLPPDGAIWVAWPKRSSGVETDITEDTLRDLFLPTGMVDNKVCAIDNIWSGLRFVVRKENRAAWPE